MPSCSVTSWSCFQGTYSLPPMTRAHFHVVWVSFHRLLNNVLQSVNHEQFPMQMTQNSKHNKWLEILAGEDFPPKLLWRTPTRIHRERIEEDHREEQGTSLRTAKATLSTQRSKKHVQRQRQNATITLQTRPMKRGNTDFRRFKKRRGDQATLEV